MSAARFLTSQCQPGSPSQNLSTALFTHLQSSRIMDAHKSVFLTVEFHSEPNIRIQESKEGPEAEVIKVNNHFTSFTLVLINLANSLPVSSRKPSYHPNPHSITVSDHLSGGGQ